MTDYVTGHIGFKLNRAIFGSVLDKKTTHIVILINSYCDYIYNINLWVSIWPTLDERKLKSTHLYANGSKLARFGWKTTQIDPFICKWVKVATANNISLGFRTNWGFLQGAVYTNKLWCHHGSSTSRDDCFCREICSLNAFFITIKVTSILELTIWIYR